MDWETSKKPLILAHRGFTQGHVENTLEAVEAALQLGCDGVEVDLRMTKDGELVVFHDDDLKRLADRDDELEEMTISTLREVRIGESRIPMLEELLDLVQDKALLNLEIKTVRPFSSKVEKKLLETLRSFRLGPTILVSSFHPLPLRRLRKLSPELRRGYLFWQKYRRSRYRALTERVIDPFSLNPAADSVTAELVQKGHGADRRIFVWTVNREDDMRKMIQLGVDGLFSDRPDLLIKVKDSLP